MSHSREGDPEAGLLRMLREALRAGLVAGADAEAFAMARSSAQIIGLRGLDAGLQALEPHRGPPWSGAACELVNFVDRLVAEHTLSAFRAADQDLLARAEALRQWRAPVLSNTGRNATVEPPPGATTTGEALAGMPLAGDSATERAVETWLTAQVGTALRAALEWLSSDPERSRPLRLRAEDSVLEVTCEDVQPEGLTAAHDVLAAAEGVLAPIGEIGARPAPGGWVIRVPACSPRPVHLMLEQGELRLAVPWHAVLRLSLVPTIEIEMRGGSLATPVLAPLVPLLESVGERPVVAIAHGLKRALLVADRLVWRLGAEPCAPSGPAPAAGLLRTVRSIEGEVFWVADPGVLLAEVELPKLPASGAGKAPPPPRAPEPRVLPTRPAEGPPPPAATAPSALAETLEALDAPIVLRAEDVEPIVLTGADVEPLRMVAAAMSAVDIESARAVTLPNWLERFGTTGGQALSGADAAPPAEPRSGSRGVLIAEDSIAARHFLARLFEQRGFEVHAVETAADLRTALDIRAWKLVCIDMDLPDASGRGLMDDMFAILSARDVPLVALVRDDEDAELAGACGVHRWLRKPFDCDEVDHLLSRLGLLEEKRP
ncbi:MAG: response regulator [Candidatus Eisenbacteria bacterium]